MIDRAGLADFLRRRREALQPEDVGLPRGARRHTPGLRREEVAALSHMSTDYYARLEQERGPQPSEQMLASIAQGLHLSHQERDHLFHLAGHTPPARGGSAAHISPGMLRVLDRLEDTPAEIVSELGETLRQTALGVALTGDTASLTGPEKSLGHRWFVDPAVRQRAHVGQDIVEADHRHRQAGFRGGFPDDGVRGIFPVVDSATRERPDARRPRPGRRADQEHAIVSITTNGVCRDPP